MLNYHAKCRDPVHFDADPDPTSYFNEEILGFCEKKNPDPLKYCTGTTYFCKSCYTYFDALGKRLAEIVCTVFSILK